MIVIQSTMPDLLRISLIFSLMLGLLRKKIGIGYVMLIASGALFLLYRMSLSDIIITARKVAFSSIAIKLLLSLSLIRIFELVLRDQNILIAMMNTIKSSFRSRKAVIISMPLLIGMLPSLGGAYFSAPMVEEATKDTEMSLEKKAFINYWFRHPWELILPLYPGIVFASAVSHIPLSRLAITNAIFVVALVATGFIYGLRGVGHSLRSGNEPVSGEGIRSWLNFLPILVVMILVIIAGIELHYALLLVLIPIFIRYRYSSQQIFAAVRYGFSWDVILMIAGIVLFKETMEVSGSVKNLGRFFIEHGIPLVPIFCLLPFLAGLLTGHTVGFVGSTFPLLISIGDPAPLSLVSLAFASGFIGVLLSPVHLCLILTREYFKADLSGIYKKMIPASAIVFAMVIAQYFFMQ
jgi:integral membrane protein (TIGR00529 family)